MTRTIRILLVALILAVHPLAAVGATVPENGRILLGKRTYVSTIRADGSGRRDLARGKFAGAHWSPDKSRIAYRGNPKSETSLWMMDADGTNKVTLVEETYGDFTWAPSGRRLAYVDEVEGDLLEDPCSGISIVHAATKTSRLLTEIPDCQDIANLSWSPQGDLLVFDSVDQEGHYQIYSAEVSTGTVVQLTDDPSDNQVPRWSPNGSFIAFESNRDHESSTGGICFLKTEIYVMKPDGSAQQRVTSGDANFECDPYWLPDGSGLVITRETNRPDEASRGQVRVVRLDSSTVLRLTPTHLFRVWAADVSPDGRWVLYRTLEWREDYRRPHWFMYKVAISGGKRQKILGPTLWGEPVEW